jgi:hypothetical protein
MKTNRKHGIWVLAVVVGIGVSVGTVHAVAAPFQDHEREQQQQQHETDYSKHKTYQQGMREGHNDHARNLDHSKKRHFKKDDDNKAYEAGYQKGRGA